MMIFIVINARSLKQSDENNILLRLHGHKKNFDWHFSLALTIALMVALTIADDKDVASQGKKWSSGSRRLLDGGERSLKTYFIMHLFRTEVNVTQLSKDSNLVLGGMAASSNILFSLTWKKMCPSRAWIKATVGSGKNRRRK